MAGTPYPSPLKHHTCIKEEIENILEVGLIECLIGPYTTLVIVVSGKSKQGAPLAETK